MRTCSPSRSWPEPPGRPNEIWQADHTQLDLWVVTPSGSPARPWLTVIEDDHSRVIAGYAVNLGAPSALQTALVREPPPDDANFIVTKEYRRFTEFADAVRRERYIGLCYGQPGVGKTLSARRYACWHELDPLLQTARHHFTEGRDRADWHTLLYTPTVSVTPRMIDKELTQLGSAFAVVRTPDPFDPRARAAAHALPPFVELLIIDEADRLRTAALEQLRDHYDRSQLGMILVGMPGIEKRLARYHRRRRPHHRQQLPPRPAAVRPDPADHGDQQPGHDHQGSR
ncbi:MAG TPA: ATP-binding protein [Streptosporangiaceae bacterium]|jgi:hypothetical protein|nr:ATP-binding protein [Streptosporangiaceae bacterium]HEX2818621.1 ATP-binding protein [Streptosporangiaceae bacterium]